MKIATRPISQRSDCQYRPITLSDVAMLAELMDLSYTGTIDHEGETRDQCLQEMIGTLAAGKYGPFITPASFGVFEGDKIVSASILTLWNGKPLLAFSMTLPDHQGKGLARFLIERSIDALARLREKELYLCVTEGNAPAQHLYERIGFEKVAGSPAKPVVDELVVSVIKAKDDLAGVRDLYQLCGYTGSVGGEDELVVARRDNQLLGAVRLVEENGIHLLRGMYIHPEHMRQGVGSQMLRKFDRLLKLKGIRESYLICGAHLEGYYGQIGFKLLSEDQTPAFLVDRKNGYQKTYGAQIIMRRCKEIQ